MTHESPAHTPTCTPREGHREVVGDRVGKGNKQTLKEEAKAERDREENRRQKKKKRKCPSLLRTTKTRKVQITRPSKAQPVSFLDSLFASLFSFSY